MSLPFSILRGRILTEKKDLKKQSVGRSDDKASVDDCFRVVGRVKDAHGLKGELWVVLFAGQADWLESLKDEGLFRLSKKESLKGTSESDLKEFSLKGARAHKNGVILQSKDIKDRTAAEGFKGHFLAIPENFLVAEEGDSYFLDEIEGFRVIEDKREIGVIVGFSHNGAQDLLKVALVKGVRDGVKAKDVIEIPFVEEIVFEVDDESEEAHVDLPDGLIEVQLGLDKPDKNASPENDSENESEDDDDSDDEFDENSEADSEEDSEDDSDDEFDDEDDDDSDEQADKPPRLH